MLALVTTALRQATDIQTPQDISRILTENLGPMFQEKGMMMQCEHVTQASLGR